MRPAMGRQPNALEGPALLVGQVFLAQTGEEFDHVGRRFLVRGIFDLRAPCRIGRATVLDEDGEVDNLARHRMLHLLRGNIVQFGLIPAALISSAFARISLCTSASNCCALSFIGSAPIRANASFTAGTAQALTTSLFKRFTI